MSASDRAEAWISAELARRAVEAVADSVAGLDVQLVALKGVHLAWCVAPSPEYRPMADADLLVARGSFAAVAERLRADERFEVWGDNWSTKSLRFRKTGANVDLHRMPLPPLWGAMKGSSLLEHAQPCARLAAGVLVPDLLDATCLALAHHVKDGGGRIRSTSAARDLELLLPHLPSPRALAERLGAHGLRRVGLVALTDLESSEACRPFLEALRPTPAERGWTRWVLAAIGRLAPTHPYAAFLVVRSIADAPGASLASVGFGVLRGGRDLLQEVVESVRRTT